MSKHTQEEWNIIIVNQNLLKACKEALEGYNLLSKDKVASMQGQISILEQAIAKAERIPSMITIGKKPKDFKCGIIGFYKFESID